MTLVPVEGETVRVGVVADTHVGDVLPVLPDEALTALAGVDLIVHAGDVVMPGVLERLREIAPVVAVQGNHDRKGGLALPRSALVRANGYLIGVAHGHRRRGVELSAALVSLAFGRVVTLGLEARLVRELGNPDCVVLGHLHVPIERRIDRTLVFSPGSVYVSLADEAFEPVGPLERTSMWFRGRLPPPAREPAVGIIEAGAEGLHAHRVPLTQPIRPRTPEMRGRRPDQIRASSAGSVELPRSLGQPRADTITRP